MSKTTTVTVHLDPDLKQDVEHIFSELGLSTSQAIALFYEQVQLSRGLPFEIHVSNAETREALADAETRNNLTSYDSVEDLFVDLGRGSAPASGGRLPRDLEERHNQNATT